MSDLPFVPFLPPLPTTKEPEIYNTNYVLYWNNVINDVIRLTVTIGGPLGDPPGTARVLGLVHICMNDAYFGIRPHSSTDTFTYLSSNATDPGLRLPPLNGATDTCQAVAGAAVTALTLLYAAPLPNIATLATQGLSMFIQKAATGFPGIQTQSASYQFGEAVANTLVKFLNDPSTFLQGNYTPVDAGARYKFDSDPTNPVKIVPVDVNNSKGDKKVIHFYDAPFYGATAKRLAVQGVVNGKPVEHLLGDPPVGFSVHDFADYQDNFREVYAIGGATGLNSTHRTPKQMEDGLFWAYDGTNLLGTPLRHYSQILRRIAWDRKVAGPTDEATNQEFLRLFALTMSALADAGVIAWQEKYHFSFWRPLSGVRQDNADPLQDPFWLTLGAPETNSNAIPFKPPFPSYPSGHATFGAAIFQVIRLFYKQRDNLPFAIDEPDNINFVARSDELNGINRSTLRQPYDRTMPIEDQQGTVSTDVGLKSFNSCWQAIFENSVSRVFLGVHWLFDSSASKDVRISLNPDGTPNYKAPKDIRYITTGPRHDRPGQFVLGGAPLGIQIANDIFQSGLKPTPAALQPPFKTPNGEPAAPSAAYANLVGATAVTNGALSIDEVAKVVANGLHAAINSKPVDPPFAVQAGDSIKDQAGALEQKVVA